MKEVFVIRSQQGLFLGKQGQWLDECEPAAAWRSPHHDVALNHLIECNARDIEQRLFLLQCPVNDKDIPLLGDAQEPRKSTPVTYDEPDVVTAPDDEDAGSLAVEDIVASDAEAAENACAGSEDVG
jgi:hypothetical protein